MSATFLTVLCRTPRLGVCSTSKLKSASSSYSTASGPAGEYGSQV